MGEPVYQNAWQIQGRLEEARGQVLSLTDELVKKEAQLSAALVEIKQLKKQLDKDEGCCHTEGAHVH